MVQMVQDRDSSHLVVLFHHPEPYVFEEVHADPVNLDQAHYNRASALLRLALETALETVPESAEHHMEIVVWVDHTVVSEVYQWLVPDSSMQPESLN
jgi:hypothetical protein